MQYNGGPTSAFFPPSLHSNLQPTFPSSVIKFYSTVRNALTAILLYYNITLHTLGIFYHTAKKSSILNTSLAFCVICVPFFGIFWFTLFGHFYELFCFFCEPVGICEEFVMHIYAFFCARLVLFLCSWCLLYVQIV